MRRHPNNPNLVLHENGWFRDYPVMVSQGPLVANQLAVLHDTMYYALSQHSRIFAFRCDLRFPAGMMPDEVMFSNAVLERFFASFKAKVQHNREMARKLRGYAHLSEVFYVWAREEGSINAQKHYHVAIFLNADAFNSLGNFEIGRDNLYNRLLEAWASALGITAHAAEGLVHFPGDSRFLLKREDTGALNKFFYRASYLCKAATKPFGNGVHVFGASRRQHMQGMLLPLA